MDFSGFNAAEQAHMTKVIEKKQMQDFMRMYSNLVERCFTSCCNDFTSKALSSKEEQCMMNCADKFFKTLGASGCAIRGAERRGYEYRVSTKVGCASWHPPLVPTQSR